MMLVFLILLPLISFTFYSSPMVLGQAEQQNDTPKDILICQLIEYIESLIGSSMQQVSNICNYQNSIGYNQSLSELCFISSGKGIDIINAYCDKVIPTKVSTPAVNETSTPAVNEIDQTLNSQNNTDNGSRVTIFDGVSKFFSGVFNP
jgi:hypothetical protein